ncbi:MAG TPA: ATPase, T2SS/T4P/T4SS family [Dissulfurispiraceae bacterium]|nr:ATPase, T2SS/T4P/T4SS family [Dissulfurispiraceae bacterium]
MITIRKKLGEVLQEQGLLTNEQLEKALEYQKTIKKRIGETLVELNYVTKEQIVEALARKFAMPIIEFLDNVDVELPLELKNIIPKKMAKEKIIFPIEKRNSTLVLVMANPLDYRAIDDISFNTKLRISPIISYENSILDAIERYYVEGADSPELLDLYSSNISAEKEIQFSEVPKGEEHDSNIESLYSKSKAPPIVKLVAMMIAEAIKMRASDIHIEPRRRTVQVRFRVDGDLRNIFTYDRHIHESVISRIKIISSLDITNRRLPQDGSSHVTLHEKEIDLRISTIPSIYGEKVVIRLLDQSSGIVSFKELGMPEAMRNAISGVVARPQGMLLVTGPTGSGKTTTLYAALNHIMSESRNIVTIEDPVEYKIEGITQIQVNEDIGRSFANILRSVLRQDPDVIKVGEIRDGETAEIAMRASMTGHFVLSTLHTNSTAATITRLIDVGVAPYLLGSALSAVLAQRLVRRICEHCKIEVDVDEELSVFAESFGLPHINRQFKGEGCQYCYNTGYLGRIAIYEYLPVTLGVKTVLFKEASEIKVAEVARLEGVRLLFEDAWEKAGMGITTTSEVMAKIPLEEALKKTTAKKTAKKRVTVKG